MNARSGSLLLRVAIALAIGLIEPSLEIAWKCRTGLETTEACVWGRSYLPLGRVIGLLVIAPLAFAVLSLLRWAWVSRLPGRRN